MIIFAFVGGLVIGTVLFAIFYFTVGHKLDRKLEHYEKAS